MATWHLILHHDGPPAEWVEATCGVVNQGVPWGIEQAGDAAFSEQAALRTSPLELKPNPMTRRLPCQTSVTMATNDTDRVTNEM